MTEATKTERVGLEYDPEAQSMREVPLGEREFFPYPAMKFAEALREHGVTVAFGAPGGHIWPLVDAISRIGINTITFGHEQSAVYAAEAYSQVSRKTGVAYATAGPGMTNSVSGVNQAWLSQSPLLVLYGAHDVDVDGQYRTMQEGYAVQVLGSMTKQANRIVHPNTVKGHITRGIQLANAAPRGPVALEATIGCLLASQAAMNVLGFGAKARDDQYVADWREGNTAQMPSGGPGEPRDIAAAVRLIQEAKAPAFLIGDGAGWCDAGPELEELVNLLQLPFTGRRNGKGVISDNHPHSVRGKVPFSKETDLLITWGTKVGNHDQYGRSWPRVIQVSESIFQLETFLKTPVAIIGNIKSVALHMIEYIKANNIQPPAGRAEWIAKLRAQTAEAAKRRREKAMYYGLEHPHYRKHDVLHHGYVSQVIADYLEERYQSRVRVIVDGFTISDYAPPFLKATRPAAVIGSTDQGGVGHGVGMAIGAAFAQLEQDDPTPILVLMGDSGMGNSAPDVEVAARYNLPIVFLVSNNNGWMPSAKYTYYGNNWEALGPDYRDGKTWHGKPMRGQERLPQDWAGVGRDLGCGGETVKRHEDFQAALHRAFQSAEQGKPVVLDCIMDPSLLNRQTYSAGYALMWAHIPWEETPARGKAVRKATLSWAFPGLQKEQTAPIHDPWEPFPDEDK